MAFTRSSGVFLHVTALPGRGRGTLGDPARTFVDWLDRAGQSLWQICPLGPTATAHGNSPYTSYSAFAGNSLLIDLDDLVDRGYLDESHLDDPGFDPHEVEFDRVEPYVTERLRTAFERFEADPGEDQAAFERFREENDWLADYALFRALKAEFDGAAWWEWPDEVRERDPDAIAAYREELADEVRYHEFCQFLFDRQWRDLRTYANDRGIELFGDMPIYVGRDSADVWASPETFQLDEDYRPTAVAGVPPTGGDSGQRWGNPLYDWDYLRETGFEWWLDRFDRLFDMVDLTRIDHFRGFDEFYAIPADAEDPAEGEWQPCPGERLFETVREHQGGLPVVAEDLGHLTQSVHDLRGQFGFPGMLVVHYADWHDEADRYVPANYPSDVVGYTGTHDTDTVVGWYRDLPDHQREALHRRLETDGSEIHWDVLNAVWKSEAVIAMAPLQDVLGLGSEARFNTPGTAEGNWRWRVTREGLTDDLADRLRRLTEYHGRLGE